METMAQGLDVARFLLSEDTTGGSMPSLSIHTSWRLSPSRRCKHTRARPLSQSVHSRTHALTHLDQACFKHAIQLTLRYNLPVCQCPPVARLPLLPALAPRLPCPIPAFASLVRHARTHTHASGAKSFSLAYLNGR